MFEKVISHQYIRNEVIKLRGRITSKCIESLKEKLPYYIETQGTHNKGGSHKFRCFNAAHHNHRDKDYSAAIVPKSGDKYWTCFACGARGDIFKAVEYCEGISNFHEKLKFLSNKLAIPLEYENIENEQEQVYYYKDSEDNLLYKIIRYDRHRHTSRPNDGSANEGIAHARVFRPPA